MRIALLTHSTNPRGGVVHALELAEALGDLGHEAVVHAPDVTGAGFFRSTRCTTRSVQAQPVDGDLAALVERRIAEYAGHFREPRHRGFDLYHAQDPIGANALAVLKAEGAIPGFVRTVHHLDRFDDPRLAAWQDHGVRSPTRLCCVSRTWQEQLRAAYGREATLVGNGVDVARFRSEPRFGDRALAHRLGLGGGPIFLSIGGVEERKNSLMTLEAFVQVRADYPDAQLVIAGGATLLDHGPYQTRFHAALQAHGLRTGPGQPVVLTGPLAQDDMPGLYRLADALVFPSLREGFGLVVLEAMACGTAAIVSRIAPFTEYLGEGDCLWVDPQDPASIAAMMARSLRLGVRERLAAAGHRLAARFSWREPAERHIALYEDMLQRQAAHA